MIRKHASLEILDAWRVPAGNSPRALKKAAHRVQFEYTPRHGYLYVRSRMISSRCNDNHDEFPAPEIEKGWKSFLGKPVFVNHHNSNHRRARGVIVAAALHRDRNPDGTPDTWVEGLMEIDALKFPRLAEAILKRRINRTSMGVDVERSTCSACGNVATSPAEYCRHLPALKGKKIRLRREGKVREEIIREICAGLSFFENSLLVEEPADPTAVMLGDVDARGLQATAELHPDSGPSRKEAAARAGGDHPFFQANPVNVRHIIEAYNESGEDDRAIGRNWYPESHHIAKAMGHSTGHDTGTAAGVISAYSPQTAWPVNLHNASRALRGDPPKPGSGAMNSHYNAAVRILSGQHYNDVLRAPKTNAFARLIHHGGDTEEDQASGNHRVVVDRHALSVAIGRRVSKDDISHAPLDKIQHYEHVADAYRQAASELTRQHGHTVHPHEVQAVTWMVQIKRNQKEDAELRGRLGRGRITRDTNAWRQWGETAREHHPDIPGENMHMSGSLDHSVISTDGWNCDVCGRPVNGQTDVSGTPVIQGDNVHHIGSLDKTAYGETAVPPKINTLRQEECPVCGEANVWTGQRCPVCGFVAPPDLFRDPDVDKAALVRQELEQAGDEGLGLPQGPADEAMGSFPDADHQLFHPDQITPNGVPAVQGELPVGDMENGPQEDEELPPGEEPEEEIPGDEDEQEEEAQAVVLGCPACGSMFEPGDQGAQEGSRCPACGQAPLEPVDAEPEAEKDQEPSPAGGTVMGVKTAQREQIAGLRKENSILRAQLAFVAELAGVRPQLDEIRRQADLLNPASPVPDPPEEAAPQSTEEALASGGTEHSGPWPRGTGHSEDDPSRPGTTPGANANVPAAQTTTAITPGVEMQTPPARQLIDVTAPVQGTNPSQDGGVPIQQRRIETDVRIDPDPLKAHGPGIGGVGNDGTGFPWVIGAREKEGVTANGAIRTMAAMRLGRLRIQAGLAQGDDLDAGAAIERDASLSVHDIEREIEVLSQVERRRPSPMQRQVQRRTAARVAPSMASAPSVPVAYATIDDADAYDIFLD